MLARYYGTSLGRFMSPDPLPGHVHLPQTLNRYPYAGNSPVRFFDPDGRDFYLKCKGESDTCHGGKQGKWNKDKNGKNTRFEETVISSDPGGNLHDQEGNKYTGEVDGAGVHFTKEGTGNKPSTGTWARGTNEVSFSQASGALAGLSYRFSEPHFGQDAWGTFYFKDWLPGSGARLEMALSLAGLEASSVGAGHIGQNYRSDGGPRGTNSTHLIVMNPGDRGPFIGDLHTGENYYKKNPVRHLLEAAVNGLESLFED